jgi:exodeoxyribonuclease-3
LGNGNAARARHQLLMEPVKIVTWNVNGLRSILRKNFYAFAAQQKPNILCLQETRIDAETCPQIEGFKYTYFNHSTAKKGYAGTAIFSDIEPLSVRCLDADAEHPEGRILVAEFKKFFLINTYVPNSQGDLQRLSYRIKVWDATVRSLVKKLQATKPVLWCGDLNVAHQPIDLSYPDANHLSAGFTDEERACFTKVLESGYIDSFRYFYPNQKDIYSWWSYMFKSREKNAGWRIDYFVVSEKLKDRMKDAKIHTDIMGSDHCPVELDIE